MPTTSAAPPGDHILVIDDDVELCKLLAEYLGPIGFHVDAVHHAKDGVERTLTGRYGLVVLDVMLPGANGFDVLRRVREASAVPVLMLTARGDDVDRIVGLELGADDYLPKPFNPRELVARIQAILRRTHHKRPVATVVPVGERLVVGDVAVDFGARMLHRGGALVELTGVEFTLAETLLRAAGTVVSREALSRDVLGREIAPYDRSLDMHVSNLRKKLGPTVSGAQRIRTVRGTGYVYTITPDPALPAANAT
jgi:two-component system, OmpR family, response regulator CpxR